MEAFCRISSILLHGLVLCHKTFWMSFLMQRKNQKTGFDHLLRSDKPQLQQMMSKIYQLEALNEQVMSVIEPQFHPHCRVCNLRDGILVIGVASSTWMTPLRFQCPDILQKLRQIPAFAGIIKIELKVHLPVIEAAPLPGKTVPPLSAAVAAHYLSLADACEDPELQAVLRRIAAH